MIGTDNEVEDPWSVRGKHILYPVDDFSTDSSLLNKVVL